VFNLATQRNASKMLLRGRLCRLVVFCYSSDAFTLWRNAIFLSFFLEVKR
jgi:hypothetical protein